MAMRTATITIDADLATAYNTAPKPQQREALSVFRQALRVVAGKRKTAASLSKQETALFLKINRSLSEPQQQRLAALNEKIEESQLTEKEHAELLRLTDRVEKLWVERLRAIIELAKLRKLPPEELMRQLEIEPPSYGK